MSYKQFTVRPDVIEQAHKIGLYGRVGERLIRMARRAAPFTHPHGNRRFDDYVLCIEQGVITHVLRLDRVQLAG